MDLKWLILVLEILLVSLMIPTSSARKRKRTNSKPHVEHVSAAKENANSLIRNANSNTITVPDNQYTKIGKSNIRNTSKSKRTISGLRRLIKKKKLIVNVAKRKRVLKRLRKELAKLKRKSRSRLKKCKTASDCDRNECCIKKFTLKGAGRCRKRPKLNHRCRPALLPGLDVECPCRLGLTCTPFKTTKSGYFKFRCESIKLPEEEIEPQAVTGLGRFK